MPGNMWEEKTIYETTGRTRSAIRLAWREAHLLDPTKIMKHCLSEEIGNVRPPSGFDQEISGMEEMYSIRRSIHQSHPEQRVQYTKRDFFFDRVLNSTVRGWNWLKCLKVTRNDLEIQSWNSSCIC